MDKTVYYAWLSMVPWMDAGVKAFLMTLYEGPENVFKASGADLKQTFESYPQLCSASKEAGFKKLLDKELSAAEISLEAAERFGAKVLVCDSADYPAQLKDIPNPPVVLYCRGRLELLKEPGVAIVGTRRASPYGKWVSSEISSRVASLGKTVISGMAEGIDSCAHRACIKAGGDTIAVFGTGVDVCFPRSGLELYKEITEEHLAVSEYPMGQKGYPSSFPERNRIISGLSEKVIIAEGAYKSGSMITACLGLEHGRDVYSVPGNINQPNSKGSNLLISDGACPITDLDELAQTLGYTGAKLRSRLAKLSPEEKLVYKYIKESGSISAEELASDTCLPFPQILALSTALQLKKLITKNGNYLSAT